MRPLFPWILAIVFVTGCAQSPIVRGPATTKAASAGLTIDEIDPRFEHPWGGNLSAEHDSLQKLGTTIADFVTQEEAQNEQWRTELGQLKAQDPATLSLSQQKRMKEIELILNDLPNRGGLATRDVHRRPQACVNATLTLRADLPPEDTKGLFQPGARFDAIVRFSNGNPKNQPDYTPDARGMAVKLLKPGSLQDGVTATELNEDGLLDILAINFPVFFMNNPDQYVTVNQAFLDVSSDPGVKLDPKSWFFRLGEAILLRWKGLTKWEQNLAVEVNGSIIASPLHAKYWSMMAYRLGEERDSQRTAIKYIWAPCTTNLPEGGDPAWATDHDFSKVLLTSSPFDAIPDDVQATLSSDSSRYYLRDTLFTELQTKKCFHLQIQRYIDETSTPVEDTTHIWLENDEQRNLWAEKFAQEGGTVLTASGRRKQVLAWEIASPVTIGELEIEPVAPGSTPNSALCEDLSFNPWNNVPSAHKPLGVVARMRKAAYHGSRKARHGINGVQDGSLQDHHDTE